MSKAPKRFRSNPWAELNGHSLRETPKGFRSNSGGPHSHLEPVPAISVGGLCGPALCRFRGSSHHGCLLLQLLHVLQHSILGLSVLQQRAHVKDVVQVGLNLHLQLVALREPKPLSPGRKVQGKAWCEGSFRYPPITTRAKTKGPEP